MNRICLILAAVAVAACSSKSSTLEPKVPESLDATERQVITSAWPKVRKACPGLDRFASALQPQGVESNQRLDVVFEVKEGDASIPSNYMASGHRCFFGISRDGASLAVAKEGCKAVCLGRPIQSDEPLASKDLLLTLQDRP